MFQKCNQTNMAKVQLGWEEFAKSFEGQIKTLWKYPVDQAKVFMNSFCGQFHRAHTLSRWKVSPWASVSSYVNVPRDLQGPPWSVTYAVEPGWLAHHT